MQRTVHEVLELRDLIVACDAVANKLLHAASTARDADVVQMLGAHERTFRQQCHQLKQALAGEGGLYGLGASWDGGTGATAPGASLASTAIGAGGPLAPGGPGGLAGPGGRPGDGWGPSMGPGVVPAHGPGAGAATGRGPAWGTGPAGAAGTGWSPGAAGPAGAAGAGWGAGAAGGTAGAGTGWGPGAPGAAGAGWNPSPAGRGGPGHPAEAGGAPGYPPTGPGTYSYRPSAAAQDHRYPAGAGAQGRGAAAPGGHPGGPARAGDPAGDGWRPIRGGSPELGPRGDGADATRDALRHRPELVGWEPGAGNNEGWQAGARREPAGLEARWEGGLGTAGPAGAGRAGALDRAAYWRAGLAGAREPEVAGYGAVAGSSRMEAAAEWRRPEEGPAARAGAPRGMAARAGRPGGGDLSAQASGREAVRPEGAPGAEAFTAVRPVGYGPGAAAQVAGSPVPVAEAGPGFRGHWTAQGGPEGGPGTSGIRFDSPRVGFGPEWAPNPWTGPAAGSTPGTGLQGDAFGRGGAPQTAGYTAPASAWRPEAAQSGPVEAGAVRLADPDALAIADCLQDCKHMALRMMVAATEAADRHLRRTLYQMAGQHLEMAGQHYEWLRRRGFYTVPPAPADLVRHLEDDVRRMEQALKVLPATEGAATGAAAVNTSLAGYPSGGLKGAFGGQQIRN